MVIAKCPICNSRKGERQCLIAGSFVCSLCCGNTRKADLCLECRFYQQPKRKYMLQNDQTIIAVSTIFDPMWILKAQHSIIISRPNMGFNDIRSNVDTERFRFKTFNNPAELFQRYSIQCGY